MYRPGVVATSLASLFLLGACQGTAERAADQASSGASLNADLGNDFSGNYLWVHGTRSVAVDAKYPCLNEVTACLALDASGKSEALMDLCPSIDTPEGTWTFEYALYADKCGTPLANVACVIAEGATLAPGANHNQVQCLTTNAQTDFQVCLYDPVTKAGFGHCLYEFSGVKNDLPIADLNGWTQCFLNNYQDNMTPLVDIFTACPGGKLLLGCRLAGANVLQVAAMGNRADVLYDTGSLLGSTVTHTANGVAWYFNGSLGWGFAPAGAAVYNNSCDMAGPGEKTRLCWHTGFPGLPDYPIDHLNYGFRCGTDTYLQVTTTHERLIFTAE